MLTRKNRRIKRRNKINKNRKIKIKTCRKCQRGG